jgi:N-acetylmuramic acid 6-phosphate etherase
MLSYRANQYLAYTIRFADHLLLLLLQYINGVGCMDNTESFAPRFIDIDSWPTSDAVEAMLDGQIAAIASIKNQIPQISIAAEAAAKRLLQGGRLVYVGAGTSGRVAVQDGVELGPTFGWPQERLVYLLAGGIAAMARSIEGAEDDADAARDEISANNIGPNDVVIAVAASGKTPFTLAAVEAARNKGALTISIANNPDTPLLSAAEYPLFAATGSEVIAGSTRMKAGTAQKAILNILSSAIMIRLGRVYQGLMVDMVISNDKLLLRAIGIISTIAKCSEDDAKKALRLANKDIKTAILIAMGQNHDNAIKLLNENNGILRHVIEALR